MKPGERQMTERSGASLAGSVLDALPEAVLVLDLTGAITLANRPAAQLLDLQRRFLIGQHYDAPALFESRGWKLRRSDLEGEPVEPSPPHPVEEVLVSGEPYEHALFVLDRPGHGRKYIEVDARPLRAELGGTSGVIVIFSDVTEERAARTESEWLRRDLQATQVQVEELLRLSEALNAINATIHSTLDRAEVLDRVVREAAMALRVESAFIELLEDDAWVPRVAYGLPGDILGRRLRPVETRQAAIAAETGEPLVVADAFQDARFDTETLRLLRMRSFIAVPLLTRGQVVGVLTFGHPYPSPFEDERVGFASKVAAATSLAMENARMYTEERHIADTLQQALLVVPSEVQGIATERVYKSATEAAYVGGDFFDLFELPADRIGIVIGDVSGKGVEASTLASFTRQLLRAHASQYSSPAEVVARTNDLVYRVSRTEDFVTLFLGVVSLTDGILTFCNAGHPSPVVCRDGLAEPLTGSGPLAGAWGDLGWENHTTRFANGDLLVLYTDGVIEAKRDGELFGEERLTALVQSNRSAPLADLASSIVSEVTAFAGGRLRDDLALMLVQLQR